MELRENERLDFVNDSLSLIQNTEGLTFGTDALLLAAYIGAGYARGVELGGGTGIISMLLAARGKIADVTCAEIQEEYVELIARNIEYNSLSERMRCVAADVRELRLPECDAVYTNPPYMRTDTGYSNRINKKNIARHEVCGDIYDFCKSAEKMLKFGGCFAAVYRQDRLIDLIDAMRKSRIEPKRITFVHADQSSEPSMALVEGKKGGRCGLLVTKPLIIYSDASHEAYSEDMNFIMENGSFPSAFKR